MKRFHLLKKNHGLLFFCVGLSFMTLFPIVSKAEAAPVSQHAALVVTPLVIYKTIQPNGIIAFSDQPSNNSQVVPLSQLADLNSFSVPVMTWPTKEAPVKSKNIDLDNNLKAQPVPNYTV